MPYTSSTLTEEQVKAEQASFIRKVYAWMAGGLATTGLIALFIASSPAALNMIYGNFPVFIGLVIFELILVGVLAGMVRRMSALTASLVFLFYSALNGVTLAWIFLVYTSGSIATTFFITAGTFAGMSIYGYFTKQDLTRIGNIALMALFGIIIASIANWFMKSETLYWIITYAGVFIFVTLVAYDTQKIKQMNVIGNEGTDEDRKEAIMGALMLYLDFINLFLFLLRIFGNRK